MISRYSIFTRQKVGQSIQSNVDAIIGKFNYFSIASASSKSKSVKSPKVKVTAVKDNEKKKRHFTAIFPDFDARLGRYAGYFPRTAAAKALSSYVRYVLNEQGPVKKINFSIQEVTAGSAKKVYNYSGSRDLLPSPLTRTVKTANGEPVTITSKFKYSVFARR